MRSIRPSDVNDKYITSLESNHNQLKYVDNKASYASQMEYIESISGRGSDYLVGLFYENRLIGTCGAQERIDSSQLA